MNILAYWCGFHILELKFQSRHPGFPQDALLLKQCHSFSKWDHIPHCDSIARCGLEDQAVGKQHGLHGFPPSLPKSVSPAGLQVEDGAEGIGGAAVL